MKKQSKRREDIVLNSLARHLSQGRNGLKPGEDDMEAIQEMLRIKAVLAGAHHRFCKSNSSPVSPAGDAVDWASPLEELMAREEEALVDAEARAMKVLGLEGIELPEAVRERIREEVFCQFRQYEETLLEWIFAAGPNPLDVMKRLFCYVKMKRASLIYNMGFRQIGKLLKETGAAAQLRCRALFGTTPAGWSKPATAVARMRDAQQGNVNRLGGRKVSRF